MAAGSLVGKRDSRAESGGKSEGESKRLREGVREGGTCRNRFCRRMEVESRRGRRRRRRYRTSPWKWIN